MSRESHDALSIRIGIKRNSKQGLCLAGDRGADAKEDGGMQDVDGEGQSGMR